MVNLVKQYMMNKNSNGEALKSIRRAFTMEANSMGSNLIWVHIDRNTVKPESNGHSNIDNKW